MFSCKKVRQIFVSSLALALALVSVSARAEFCAEIFSLPPVFRSAERFDAGTGSGSQHYVVEFEGRKYLLKTPDLRLLGSGVRNEVLAYRISEELDFHVVPRAFRAQLGVGENSIEVSAHLWIEGLRQLHSNLAHQWRGLLGGTPLRSALLKLSHETERQDLAKIVVLDFLISQRDRLLYGENPGNLLRNPVTHHLFAIDNSRSRMNGWDRLEGIPEEFLPLVREFAQATDLTSRLEALIEKLQERPRDFELSPMERDTLVGRAREVIELCRP